MAAFSVVLQPCLFLQLGCLIGFLPTKLGLVTAEMTIARSLSIYRLAKIEGFDDTPRSKLEVLANQLGDLILVDLCCTQCVDADRDRIGHSHGICQLDFDPGGQTCSHNT